MKRIAPVLCAVLLLTSCLGWFIEKPTFTVKEISIHPVSLTELNLVIGVEAHNPNGYDLELQSLDFKLTLNEREIGNGILQKSVLIRKSCTSEIRIPIACTYANLSEYLKSALLGREVTYKLAGNARIKAGPASARIPFLKEGSINSKK